MNFKIGTTDYSGHVIAGSYKVNSAPVYSKWTDANGVEHRQKTRDRISGSFDMFFKKASEYGTFINELEANKTTGLTVPLTLTVSNLMTDKTGNFFVEHSTTLNRNSDWEDVVERFTVKVQEA